ncbi:MAG: YfiR family protein [Salinivirgaceae bacterium]|nr:YfiR family protein [Salinivirgaceae bacterium]
MKKICFLVIGLLFVIHNVANAQDEKFKALFIYNFTKYMEWPEVKHAGDFKIGVLGSSPITNELKAFTAKKTVGEQKIVVEEIMAIADCPKYHIVFVPTKASSNVAEVVKNVAGRGVLVVTDKQGLAASYSGINFVKSDGQQSFEISVKHIQEQGVSAGKSLLSLGIKVD